MKSRSMQCKPVWTYLILGEYIKSPIYLSNAVILKSKDTPEIRQSSMKALVNLVVSYKVMKPTNAR